MVDRPDDSTRRFRRRLLSLLAYTFVLTGSLPDVPATYCKIK